MEFPGKARCGKNGMYGAVNTTRGLKTAHRYAYEVAHDVALTKDEQADHLCRNTLCWTPDHVEIVDSLENRRRAGQVKLTRDEALEIRIRANDGEDGHALAEEYGVTYRTVRYIARGERW